MNETEIRMLFEHTADLAAGYRKYVTSSSPYASAGHSELRTSLGGRLPSNGRDPRDVIDHLFNAARPGLTGSTGQAFFGWVIGGSHPAGVAADWLTSAWGQNAGIYQSSPAAAIAEEVAGKWLLDLFDLPRESSVGFCTGATMAGFTCLAAARGEVLKRLGWDVNEDGLFGAPPIPVFISQQAHSTIFAALRYLGFGQGKLVRIKADSEGRMDTDALAKKLTQHAGPGIIIAQAGHINSGAFDNLDKICDLAQEHDSWVHVDGAFGLWARTSPSLSLLGRGIERADSWSVDGHKWLQVPYDSGYAIVRNPEAHRNAMAITASYLNVDQSDGGMPSHYVPELSRRARGFATWVMLQTLGRSGVGMLVDRACDTAKYVAKRLSSISGIRILHDVCLNQISFAFEPKRFSLSADEATHALLLKIQQEGRWFIKEAYWCNRRIIRLSFSGQLIDRQLTEELLQDVARACEQIQSAFRIYTNTEVGRETQLLDQFESACSGNDNFIGHNSRYSGDT